MHERFSDRARRAMALANQEAVRLKHDYLSPAHIFLGVLAKGDSVGTMVLRNLDANLDQLRADVARLLEPGDKALNQTKLAQRPETQKVVSMAIDEARKLGHRYVGTEHLLLGILREGTSIPARVLTTRGVNIERLREEVLTLLRASTDESHHRVGDGHSALEWVHQQELAKAFHSPRFWHRLILAVDEANRLGHGEIDDEHLLLALLREPDSFVAQLLAEKGVTLDWLRDRVTRSPV